ncbi:MAG: hypothetical protein QNK05_23300 [Myxococcota bacterium]|nr:hypothetical protein [Myxococcota bacterium]
MALSCVLWDFGDTLADQDWMLQAPTEVPEWPDAWSAVARGELEDRWNRGEADLDDVVAEVARRLPMSEADVHEHVRFCCSRIRFFDLPLQIARDSSLPQALVTVNPAGFSEWVLGAHGLTGTFAPIVVSGEEGIVDKGALCQIALERLGRDTRPGSALLIDNLTECIESWAARGGIGYHFRGESQLRADLEGPLRELAASRRQNRE